MGWHLDGRVTAVAGTHTHVQTADERVLPKGTAYITDAGMTGPHDSIIGVTIDAALVAGSCPACPQVRGGQRRRAAQRGDRHRRSGDRQGDRDRARQPVAGRGRGARRGARRHRPALIRRWPISSRSRSKTTSATARRAGAAPRPQRRIQTVAELTAAIRGTLESGFGDVWVEGEISNCRVWNTGHAYFTLKDDSAQIKAVMFRSAVRYLRFGLEDGLHVVARGRLGVYEPKGEYQLQCEHLQPRGLGALQLAFEQLKKKLQAEGLFAAARKRPLPALPRKIGIVTSLDGAALRDIIKVLRRRHPNAHLVIRPARVQGESAAAEIARGLRAIARVPGVDVVILGPRRRLDRGSVGVQRGGRGAGDCRLPGAGHRRGRARGRRDDRRLRRRPARADAVGGGGARGHREGRVLPPHRSPVAAGSRRRRAARSPAAAPRCRRCPTAAGWPAGRRAWRLESRHASELALPAAPRADRRASSSRNAASRRCSGGSMRRMSPAGWR